MDSASVTVYGGLTLPRVLGAMSKAYTPWAGLGLTVDHVATHPAQALAFLNHRNELEERTKARGFGPVQFKGLGGRGHTPGGSAGG